MGKSRVVACDCTREIRLQLDVAVDTCSPRHTLRDLERILERMLSGKVDVTLRKAKPCRS